MFQTQDNSLLYFVGHFLQMITKGQFWTYIILKSGLAWMTLLLMTNTRPSGETCNGFEFPAKENIISILTCYAYTTLDIPNI
jgi:hypothetical protein